MSGPDPTGRAPAARDAVAPAPHPVASDVGVVPQATTSAPRITRLSALDLSPVGAGTSVGDALRSSIELAAHVERLGYDRYWVAEHHGSLGIASSSPAMLLALVASSTSTIRLGAGGVMLPNHAPLAIAEQFGMLEALHPGRIDLGLGRAPGTDPLTAQALRRRPPNDRDSDLHAQLVELVGWFTGRFPEGHQYARLAAAVALGHLPELWILGSSDYGAHLAGQLGLPFAFAHHFAAANTVAAVQIYRAAFRPSAVLERPHVMLGVAVVCAATQAEADFLAGSSKLSFVRLRTGRPGPLPTPDEAATHDFTPMEREVLRGWTPTVGDPATVAAGLDDLVRRTGADELSITTMVHDPAARRRSYSLLAEAWGVVAPTERAAVHAS